MKIQSIFYLQYAFFKNMYFYMLEMNQQILNVKANNLQ